jgi:dephospho-CoA kinase
MLVVGLTGGIGSGKSTVANFFSALGINVFDADLIAREIVAPGTLALDKIITRFGSQIINDTGYLNRSKLRNIIFSDPAAKLWLENLLHPLVRTRMRELVQQATSPYCLLMIPLLLEGKPNDLVQRILVVDAPEELQVNRTQLRDKASVQQINQIMQTQVSRSQRLAKADEVIVNDGDLSQLESQVANLHVKYLSLIS